MIKHIVLSILCMSCVFNAAFAQSGNSSQDDIYQYCIQRINETRQKISRSPNEYVLYTQLAGLYRLAKMYNEELDARNSDIRLYKEDAYTRYGWDIENDNPPVYDQNGYKTPEYIFQQMLFGKYESMANCLIELNRVDAAYALIQKYRVRYGASLASANLELMNGNYQAAISEFLAYKNKQLDAVKYDIQLKPGDEYFRKEYNRKLNGEQKLNQGLLTCYINTGNYTDAADVLSRLMDTAYGTAISKRFYRNNGNYISFNHFCYALSYPRNKSHFGYFTDPEPHLMLLLGYLIAGNTDSAYAVADNFIFHAASDKNLRSNDQDIPPVSDIQNSLYILKAKLLVQKDRLEDAMAIYNKLLVLNPYDRSVKQATATLQQLIARQKTIDHQAPVIELFQPSVSRNITVGNDVITLNNNKLTVVGRATDISGIRSVTVNGAQVDHLDNDGTFQTQLTSFKASLNISATDNNGNTANQAFHVTVNDTSNILPIEENFHAILIACSRYTQFPSLPSTIGEADAFASVLQSKYGFSNTNIHKVYNNTPDEIKKALSLASNLGENDNLIIYYAGHGTSETLPDGKKEGFWVPAYAETKDQYISTETLDALIGDCKAKHILIISDACFSGAMLPAVTAGNVNAEEMKSREFLSSGYLESVPGESYFIQKLTEALTLNKKEVLSDDILYSRILEDVEDHTHTNVILTPYGNMGNRSGHFCFKIK